jgi:hypothetical protein
MRHQKNTILTPI